MLSKYSLKYLFDLDEVIRKLHCKHIFHDKCIVPWLAKKDCCPNCRFDIKEYLINLNNDF